MVPPISPPCAPDMSGFPRGTEFYINREEHGDNSQVPRNNTGPSWVIPVFRSFSQASRVSQMKMPCSPLGFFQWICRNREDRAVNKKGCLRSFARKAHAFGCQKDGDCGSNNMQVSDTEKEAKKRSQGSADSDRDFCGCEACSSVDCLLLLLLAWVSLETDPKIRTLVPMSEQTHEEVSVCVGGVRQGGDERR